MEVNVIIILVQIVASIVLGLYLKHYLPKYFEEKAKNLATKEDIGLITKEVEEVKNIYKNYYDLSKSEREFYSIMIEIFQDFLAEIKRYELNNKTKENSTTKAIILKNPDLKVKYLEFIDAANNILAQAFVFLGEESYKRFKKSLKAQTTFSEMRYNFFDAMRQSIYPETGISAKEDSWDLKY
jgi:hypothetical protein